MSEEENTAGLFALQTFRTHLDGQIPGATAPVEWQRGAPVEVFDAEEYAACVEAGGQPPAKLTQAQVEALTKDGLVGTHEQLLASVDASLTATPIHPAPPTLDAPPSDPPPPPPRQDHEISSERTPPINPGGPRELSRPEDTPTAGEGATEK